MIKKPLRNLSVNALQLIINQVSGLVIFYILSTTLNKNSFGQINLALAILLAVFNILSLGIDQVIIKKIAAGNAKQLMLSLYVGHVLFTGLLFYGILLAGMAFIPHVGDIYNLILLIGIGKLMIYFSTPFKQAANGMEQFKLLAYLSIISNLVRSLCLVAFALFHAISLPAIIAIFIVGDTSELLIGIYLFKSATKMPLVIQWNRLAYLQLLRESLPQTGVVLITSALARFDWIFIGFILSAVKLAEYSFTYKIFEMATLPLLAIAPLLIPRFTKIFKQDIIPAANLKFLIRMEFIVASLIALLLNICWSPVIDKITNGKYGAINENTIFILSLCMPFLYLNNFLWTIYFAKGQLKMILTTFIITLFVNIAADVVLIPIYKNEGAAIAFLLSCIAQSVFFLKKNSIPELNNSWQTLIICIICALCGGLVARTLLPGSWLMLPLSVVLYFISLLITQQLRPNDRERFKLILL